MFESGDPGTIELQNFSENGPLINMLNAYYSRYLPIASFSFPWGMSLCHLLPPDLPWRVWLVRVAAAAPSASWLCRRASGVHHRHKLGYCVGHHRNKLGYCVGHHSHKLVYCVGHHRHKLGYCVGHRRHKLGYCVGHRRHKLGYCVRHHRHKLGKAS